MPSIRRSLILSFASSYTGLLITVPTIMIMARFLTPAETGIFSVALAVTNLAHMLRDFGVGGYLIQERHLDRAKFRSAFTIALVMAWFIAAGIAVAAPAVARFYHEPGVRAVLWVLAINFVFVPIGAPAMTLLRRELAYGALYVINTIAGLARSLTSIIMVVLGFSYMSLAWGSLAGIVMSSLCAAMYRPRHVLLMPGLSEWRSVLSFGTKKTIIDITTQFGNNANSLIVGKMLGFGATGLFSRGAGLINLFKNKFQGAISSVAYPAFAGRNRAGGNVNLLFAKSIAYVTGVAWPFYGFATVMAWPIILAAYGPQWLPAVPVLRLLSVAAAVSTFSLYSGQLQMATGNINGYLITQVIVQPLRILMIIAGSLYSIEAVAAAAIGGAVVGVVVQYWQLRKELGIRFGHVFATALPSAGVAACTIVIPVAMFALGAENRLPGPWVELAVAGFGGAAGWIGGIYAFKHPLWTEIVSAYAGIAAQYRRRQCAARRRKANCHGS